MRTFYSLDAPLSFKATTEIPFGGVVVDDGVVNSTDNKTVFLSVRQTQTLLERPVYVNVSQSTSSYGTCVLPRSPVWVLYNTTDGTPAKGETWGPVPGEFSVRKDIPGFRILQAPSVGNVALAQYADDFRFCHGVLEAAMASGGSANTRVLRATAAGTYANCSPNRYVTVYAPPELRTGNIATNSRIRFVWQSQKRFLEADMSNC